MNPRMAVPWVSMRRGDVEGIIRSQHAKCLQETRGELDLIICIMPQNDNKSIYGNVNFLLFLFYFVVETDCDL